VKPSDKTKEQVAQRREDKLKYKDRPERGSQRTWRKERRPGSANDWFYDGEYDG